MPNETTSIMIKRSTEEQLPTANEKQMNRRAALERVAELAALVCSADRALLALPEGTCYWFPAEAQWTKAQRRVADRLLQRLLAKDSLEEIGTAAGGGDGRPGIPSLPFLAGRRLFDAEERFRGILFTLDDTSRDLTAAQRRSLTLLAEQAVDQLDRYDAQQSEKEAYANSLLQSIPDFIFVLGADGTFLDFKAEERELFLPPSEFLGKTVRQVMPPDVAEVIEEAIEQMRSSGGLTEFDYALSLRDQQRHFNARMVPFEKDRIIVGVREITQRVRSEQALARAYDLLERGSKAARIGSWDVDLRKGTVVWAEVTREIYGVDADFRPTYQSAIGFYKNRESRDQLLAAFEACTERGQRFDQEHLIVTRQGHEKWVRLIGIPVFEGTRCTHVYGLIQDIDERKRAQLQLERERQRLDYIIQGTNIGTWDWNIQTGEASINERFANIFGYTLEEITPVSIATLERFCHPGDLKASIQALVPHFKGKTEYYQFEIRLRHKAGHWVWVLNRGKVISWTRSGRAMQMYGTFQDITEKKLLEEELKASVNKFQSIYDLSPAGIALNDYETGAFVDLNASLLEPTGYTREELLRRSYWEITPREYAREEVRHRRRLRETGRYGPYEKEYIRKDGARFPVLVNGVLYTDETGRKMVLSVIQDISQQKEYERKLEQAIAVAEKANKAKSQFLANMSHEIRTPLNGVIGFADLLRRTPLTETQRQYVSTVHQSANTLLDLINDILDFSKIEAGKLDWEPEQVDLFRLGAQVTEISKYEAHKKEIELLLNMPPFLPQYLWTDLVRLRQILVNLLNNAVKFTHRGEVELKIEVVDTFPDGRATLRFSVRDTGIGIPLANQKKIFDAFAQGDSSTTRKFGGTGLGLAISNKLLGLAGSRLQLRSRLGYGSTFFFDLTTIVEPGDVRQILPPVHVRRVLIVDDNRTNRELLHEMLTTYSIQGELAESGGQALHYLAASADFDAVLMDYHMPDMDGLQAIEKIRALSDTAVSQLPVFLLYSSSEDERVVEASRRLKVTRGLIKPITMEQLFGALALLEGPGASPASRLPKEKPEPAPLATRAPLCILVAEDNPLNLMLVRSYLQNIDAQIRLIEAENGRQALTLFEEHRPQLVITDVQMPELNGYELARAIRQLDAGKVVPIIALTAGTTKGERERCLEAGMNDYLSKPILEATLRKVIRQSLGNLGEATSIEPAANGETAAQLQGRLLAFVDGEPAAYEELIRVARKVLEEAAADMEQHFADGDVEMIKKVAHRIKGTALTFKLSDLAESAIRIDAEPAADIDRYRELIAAFQLRIRAVLEKLEK